ncbi:MAG TPA: ribonuclease HII [Thermoanaerobaculia bacterium]|nr:ribonuclease HII [Thermoanaerobaculia bacterium]
MAKGRLVACDLADERRRVGRLLSTEDEARAGGFRVVAGVDEVGRGCLAGPVYAGAVALAGGDVIPGLDDSKALCREVREDLADRIRRRALGAAVGAASAAEIDALGIVPATLLAMRRALERLASDGATPEFVLLDAVTLPGLGVPQRSFVRGDALVACIAAASIVAKVARDRAREGLDRGWPAYGFAGHRGYGTAAHLGALRRHGPSPQHRLTFEGVLPGRRRKAA